MAALFSCVTRIHFPAPCAEARLRWLALILVAVPLAGQQGKSSANQDHTTMQTAEQAQASSADHFPALMLPVELLTEAAKQKPLTLDSLLAQALAADPTLAQTRAQTARTQAQARQAALYPNPTIGYEGDQIRGGSFGGGEQGAFFAQTIPLGGKLTLRRRAYEAEAEANVASTQVAQAALRNDLMQAFYSALAAQQTATVRRQLLVVAQDAVQTVYQLANVGQADAPDILATEVEQEQATLADIAAQRLYLARFHILAAIANNPNLPPAPLAGGLSEPPAAPSVEQILETNPVLLQALTQITAAQARLAAARREVAPDLQLKAGEQYNFEQLGASAANRRTGLQTFASAAITLPLWNRNQGNIAAAEADLESTRQNVRRLQFQAQQQARPLLQSYLAATQKAALYRTSILPRARRATQLYEQKYNQMAQAYPQVLVSRRILLELQLKYIDVLATSWSTHTGLENGLLTGSMASAAFSAQTPRAFQAME